MLKLGINAVRKSADLEDMPNAGDAHIQGSQVLQFEVDYDGEPPTVIVDCESKHAFDMFQRRGEALPERACPLRPKGAPAGPDGPPVAWLDTWYEKPAKEGEDGEKSDVPVEGYVKKTGRIMARMFEPKPGASQALRPADIFAVVSVTTCNDCDKASMGTVALKKERDAIRDAFHKQLQVEDFTGFDLGDDDRDHRRWTIQWDKIDIL